MTGRRALNISTIMKNKYTKGTSSSLSSSSVTTIRLFLTAALPLASLFNALLTRLFGWGFGVPFASTSLSTRSSTRLGTFASFVAIRFLTGISASRKHVSFNRGSGGDGGVIKYPCRLMVEHSFLFSRPKEYHPLTNSYFKL